MCRKNNSYIFMHNYDCKTPYVDIYIDLLPINFNLLSVLYQHYAYHQISDFEIYISLNNNITAKPIVLSNIISVVSDIFHISMQERLLIRKKLQFFFILYQHITAYSSAKKYTRLIPGNVRVQAERMLKLMKTLVLIQHDFKRIL